LAFSSVAFAESFAAALRSRAARAFSFTFFGIAAPTPSLLLHDEGDGGMAGGEGLGRGAAAAPAEHMQRIGGARQRARGAAPAMPRRQGARAANASTFQHL
jgi:hypothetical protein